MIDFAAQTVFVKEAPDHLPAWLAFIGALAVALIAAVTAQWRLRLQLRHDHELADVQDLRQVLERYLTAVNEFSELLADLWRARDKPQWEQFEQETLDKAVPVMDAINRARAALTVRIARGDPLRDATNRISDLTTKALVAAEGRDESTFDPTMNELDNAVIAAFAAAQEKVGSKLPKQAKKGPKAEVPGAKPPQPGAT